MFKAEKSDLPDSQNLGVQSEVDQVQRILAEPSNPYHILQIQEKGCTARVVKEAFNALIVKVHPDKYPDEDAANKATDLLGGAKKTLLEKYKEPQENQEQPQQNQEPKLGEADFQDNAFPETTPEEDEYNATEDATEEQTRLHIEAFKWFAQLYDGGDEESMKSLANYNQKMNELNRQKDPPPEDLMQYTIPTASIMSNLDKLYAAFQNISSKEPKKYAEIGVGIKSFNDFILSVVNTRALPKYFEITFELEDDGIYRIRRDFEGRPTQRVRIINIEPDTAEDGGSGSARTGAPGSARTGDPGSARTGAPESARTGAPGSARTGIYRHGETTYDGRKIIAASQYFRFNPLKNTAEAFGAKFIVEKSPTSRIHDLLNLSEVGEDAGCAYLEYHPNDDFRSTFAPSVKDRPKYNGIAYIAYHPENKGTARRKPEIKVVPHLSTVSVSKQFWVTRSACCGAFGTQVNTAINKICEEERATPPFGRLKAPTSKNRNNTIPSEQPPTGVPMSSTTIPSRQLAPMSGSGPAASSNNLIDSRDGYTDTSEVEAQIQRLLLEVLTRGRNIQNPVPANSYRDKIL